jgi:predicted amidophosphoribosyltransferase
MQLKNNFICEKCHKKWDGYGGKFLSHNITFCDDCWRNLSENQKNYQYKKARMKGKK